MNLCIGFLAIAALSACTPPDSAGQPIARPAVRVYSSPDNTEVLAVVTSADELDQYDGVMITIRGLVSRSKQPTLLGVDVDADQPDLRGRMAQASGQLRKRVVTEDQVNHSVANRGAGVFYWLHDPVSKRLAVPDLWSPDPARQPDGPSDRR